MLGDQANREVIGIENLELGSGATRLAPYVPRLTVDWLRHTPEASFKTIDGTLVFVDISGFTSLTERLARKGKVGAEEMTDLLNRCFSRLLGVAYEDGADLLKWGGDAVLLLFEGDGHAPRACRAAHRMRQALREMGRIRTLAGFVTLRMSVGVNTGSFHFFLVGEDHRELVVAGPAATHTALMETAASAGEIVIGADTAAALDPKIVGPATGAGFRLRGLPEVPFEHAELAPDVGGLDLATCLPAAVRRHLLSAPVEAEHRRCAIAFIEFRGTDEMLEGSDDGAVAIALDQCIRAAQQETERHDVTFLATDISSDGGKIVLLAGAPTSSGADEEGILLAVHAIMGSSQILSLRAGISEGRIFTGDFGPEFRRTYSIAGDAVNLAARIMGQAGFGQALVTEPLLERSATAFEVEALPPFSVKGKAKPIRAFSLGSPRQRTLAETVQTPLIGREQELVELFDALDHATQRQGKVVELVGEPGIGKSRLVDELTSRAGGLTVLTAHCERYEDSTPFYPFRSLLRDLLGIADECDGEGAALRLRNRIEANAPQLLPWLPLLGIAMDVPVPPTPETERLADEFRRVRLAEVVDGFLEWALPTPTVLVFDDVHWMDDASTELLGRLVQGVTTRPWLICLTRREEEAGFHLQEGHPGVTLKLGPLEPVQIIELVESSVGEQPISPRDIAALADRSGGNPLFLRELVTVASQGGGVGTLPETVEDLMTAQIDRLPPEHRRLLLYASVLGTSFAPDLLREMLASEGERLDDRSWQRLGDFVGVDEPGSFRFRHALIRDAAYERLPYRRRRQLHLSVGSALERRTAPNVDEHAELLSLHFFHGQDFERAWTYSRLAGERARGKFAWVEAAEFYRRALESARALGAIPDHECEFVFEALGDVRERLGQYDEAKTALRSARRLVLGDHVAEARLALKEAKIREIAGRYADAVRWVRRGERALEGTSTTEANQQRAQLAVWHAVLRQSQGRHREAVRWCERAIALAEEADDKAALAHAFYILDWAYMDLGQPEHAVYSDRALAIYRTLEDLPGQAVVYNNLGAWAYYQGKWADALTCYEQGREAREKTGDAVSAAMGTSNIGEILSDQGHLEEAEPLFREALRVWRAAGFRAGVADATIHLGRVASRSGRWEEALSLFLEARSEYQEVGAGPLVLETDARITECFVFQGRSSEALRLAHAALQRAKALGGVGAQVAMLHRLAGYAHLQQAERASARAEMNRSLEIARARQADFEVALTLGALADLERLEGHGRAAARSRSRSRAILDRLGVVASPPIPLIEEGDRRQTNERPSAT